MSLGSIFVGLAIAVIVIAYIARPFRAASGAAASRTDKLIEAWVRAATVPTPAAQNVVAEPGGDAVASVITPPVAPAPVVVPRAAARPASSSEAVNFCPQCGRRVTSEYRFCPGCGALLPHEEGAPSGGVA